MEVTRDDFEPIGFQGGEWQDEVNNSVELHNDIDASLLSMTPIAQSLTVTYNPHPLLPIDRIVTPTAWQAGRTVREYLIESGIDIHREIVIRHNSRLLTVIEWDRVCPAVGDFVTVEGVVSGGGNNGGSNPIAAVLSIALMIVAPYAAAALYTAMGGTMVAASAGIMVTALTAVVTIAGSMVISALFRPSQASAATGVTGQGVAESPTYSLSGGSNRMRPYEPLAVVMGTHRIFPDYGAKPYTEYDGDDQYLYQVFNFGIGNLALSDIRIGETLLSSYSDVTITRAENGVLPGFFGNVDTSEGAELAYSTGWVTRTSGADSTRLAVDIAGTFYYANDAGGMDQRSADIQVEYCVKGSGAWVPFYNGSSTITLSGASSKPQRRTLSLAVPSGQYDVRVRRLSVDETVPRAVSSVMWAVLRSYQDSVADYSNQTVLGVKIRASGQLNGTLQQLSAIAVQSTPVWTGIAWINQPTENPAWWALNFARGYRDAAGHILYGLGLPDDQIDIDAIKAFAVFCAANGLTFNVVLDRQQSAADVLNMICRCGFGSPSWASGKLGVVWDAPNQSPVMAFGMSNICKGSFNVAYLTENLADEIVATYIDRETWESSQIRVTVPGTEGTPIRPSTLEIMGCTDKAMAAKFANNIAAQQVYRRRMVTWETDFEGFVCQRGDVVILSHDLTQWGYSGRIVSLDGQTLTLDRTVPRSGASEYLMIQSPDGDMQVFTVPAVEADSDTITLPSAFALQDGYAAVDHKWYFSPLATPGKKVKIVSVKPLSESRVRLVATDEDPAYYAAWNGVFAAPATQSLLTAAAAVSRLTLTAHQIVIDNFQVNRATASWRQTGGTQSCTVRAWLNGVAINTWTGITAAAIDIDLAAQTGMLSVEVTPFGAQGSGVPAYASLVMSALPAPAAPVVVATPALFAIDVNWLFGDARQDIRYTELWFSTTNNRAAATKVDSEPFPGSRYPHTGMEPGQGGYYWARVFDTRGNPSKWSSGVNDGVYATVSTDPSALLTQLQGALGMPQLAAELAAPIAQIGGMATDILQRAIDIDGLSQRVLFERAVTDATIDVDPSTGKIKLLATAAVTTDVEARLTQAEVDINAAEGSLTSAVATLEAVENDLSSAQSQIAQLAHSISLGVSDVQIADIAGQVSGAITVESAAASQALAETAIRQALGLGAASDKDLASRARVAVAEQTIKATADDLSAEAEQRLTLAAVVDQQKAILQQEQTTRATEIGAEAQARLNLATVVASGDSANAAAIQEVQRAASDATGAVAQRTAALEATVNSPLTGLATKASVAYADQAKADAISAAASHTDTVQVSLSDSIASVQKTASASASAIEGVEAKWGVKVQTMQDGNLALAGIEVISGANGSSTVGILADRLLVYRPDGTGAPKLVFMLGSVNGVTALGFDGSMVIDGSVAARALVAKSVTADQIAAEAITADSGILAHASVGTLELAGESVIVPRSASGIYSAEVSFVAPEAMNVYILGVFTQGSSRYGYFVRLYMDANPLIGEGPADGTLGTMAQIVPVSAGSHTATIASDIHSGDMRCNILVLGIMR